jgi:hypothetical protein
MFRFAFVFFLAFGLAFISCNNDSSSETTETQGETMDVMTPTPAEFPSMEGGAPAGNLNPPHGQPGHRCDIAVGSPLDGPTGGGDNISPVFQESPVQIQTQPAVQPATQPAATGSGRINPPHGQPGHRCDISVGAPLD